MRVLWCILDWGIGHMTRSFALMKHRYAQDENIVITSKSLHQWLSKRFDYVPITIPSLNIDYRLGPIPSTFLKIPSLLQQKKFYNHLAHVLTKKFNPDIIISDNCYGFYHPDKFSVIITHQVNISLYGFPCAERIIKQELTKFSEVWIPDFGNLPGLAGILSHTTDLKHVKYIGPLSRFTMCDASTTEDYGVIITSGPPVSRISLAIIGIKWISQRGLKPIVIGHTIKGVESLSDPDDQTFKEVVCKAKIVIARAGYSTIMDLYALNKKAIVVPMPGQPEQEFIARHVARHFKLFSYRTEAQLIKEVQ